MIKFRCPNCDQKLGVPDEYIGKRVRCSKCSQPCQVPATSSSEFQSAQAKTPPAASQAPKKPSAPVQQAARPAAAQQVQRPAAKPQVTAAVAQQPSVPPSDEVNPFAGLQFDDGGPNTEALAAARQERYRQSAKVSKSKAPAAAKSSGPGRFSGVALGAGKIPLAIAASIGFMFGICIVWTFVEWFTGGLFVIDYVFPFAIAAAGASGLVMFTQERNFALGALALVLALGGITTAKIMIARCVVMKQFNTPFADLPWEQQRGLVEDPVLVYDIGTIQLWQEGQFDQEVAKSLIMANTGFESDEDYDEEAYDEESQAGDETDSQPSAETESDASTDTDDESSPNAAEGDDSGSLEQDAASSESSISEEESPREYETQHQAVCALIEPWQFADKQKAFEQYYDKYQQCSTDWLIATPIGFIVALLMTFSCWDLIVIPASLGTAFKIGMGSNA